MRGGTQAEAWSGQGKEGDVGVGSRSSPRCEEGHSYQDTRCGEKKPVNLNRTIP